ncbi:M4 family metallopeptidase [Mycolicibacterium mengxianglii]|uniref:M4 family metallopeptidase n=1 Tax=Mycolicibacterium mengxianglii TaxID=2736649 RepID=UPI0018D18CC7|nr:M4 family metallopeptidase [Mycolicibacterium mengxianglii]
MIPPLQERQLRWRRCTAMVFALGVVVATAPAVAAAEPVSATETSTSRGSADTDADTEHGAVGTRDPAQDAPPDEATTAATEPDEEEDQGEGQDQDEDEDEDLTDPPSTIEDASGTSGSDRVSHAGRAFAESASDPDTDTDAEPASDNETAAEADPAPDHDIADAAGESPDEPASTPEDTARSSHTVTTLVATQSVTVAATSPSRPVTAATMVADVLTWVGLGPLAADLPIPAIPMPRLVEMLWLAVRQSQFTWNNQRPTARPTLTSQEGGLVLGNLNAVDYDDAHLTYAVSTPARFGTVVVNADGSFTYIRDAAVTTSASTDSFTVTIDDVPGNAFRVHGFAGLLGVSGPTVATVTVAITPAAIAPAAINDAAVHRPGAVTVQMDVDGRISVIDGTFTDVRVFDRADAASLLNALAPILGAGSGFATTEFITLQRVSAAGSGVTEEFYRLRQTVDGVAVVGSEVILVTDGYGTVTGLFNYHDNRVIDVDITPEIDGSAAAALATTAVIRAAGLRPTETVAAQVRENTTVRTELVIFALDEVAGPSLAWRVDIQPADHPRRSGTVLGGATYYVYANGDRAGEVISGTSNVQLVSATSTGTDLLGVRRAITVDTSRWFIFDTYVLVDGTRDIATYRTTYNFFGLGGPAIPGSLVKRSLLFGWNASAVSAHANMAQVYDYYSAVLGRDSFDGAGAAVVASVGYNPRSALEQYFFGYANAFWDASAQQFAFGNSGGFEGAVDVVGHEFTHGVISYVVGDGGSVLDYGESGALNEAYADILGSLIEGKTGSGAWLIGEDTASGAIRSLANPAAVGTDYRAHYLTRYTGTADDAGEHWNSTIFSHAAYLMVTDPDTAGVSSETWAQVFYRSLYRLGPGAKFTDGRSAILDSAAEFGFTAAQLDAIADAFDAVGIVGSSRLAGADALMLVAL